MSAKSSETPPAAASIIHLANVSAQYGSSIFTESDISFAATTTPNVTSGMAMANGYSPNGSPDAGGTRSSPVGSGTQGNEKAKKKSCPKQHQLPMFLSKTYHMIDRCDPTVATWSATGDNFVIKNVECFASKILPQYFKHSNFSSFARQLNFYGFRKLKAEPILTADFDAQTASYVRFFHEKFQKDRPELLHQIKRATKSDQQSKDDVESLKAEISQLKECISAMSTEFDRKIAEMSYQFNHRVAAMSSEFEKLASVMQQHHSTRTILIPGPNKAPSSGLGQSQQHHSNSNMLQSLSQVAGMRLAHPSPAVGPQPSAAAQSVPTLGEKRSAEEDLDQERSQKTPHVDKNGTAQPWEQKM